MLEAADCGIRIKKNQQKFGQIDEKADVNRNLGQAIGLKNTESPI